MGETGSIKRRRLLHAGPGLSRPLTNQQMTQENTFDLQGSLRNVPLGELIVEIGQTGLSGSLRVSNGGSRTIIYFSGGRLVFAVSNARQHRLFGKLIEQKKIETQQIAGNVDPVNDFELAAYLVREGILTREQLDDVIITQIEGLLIDTLSWIDGTWEFSARTRVRQDLQFSVPIHSILLNYARCLPLAVVRERFKSVEESFSISPNETGDLDLMLHEEMVEGLFGDLSLTIADLRHSTAMPEDGLLQALYVLWLCGRIIRHDWNAAINKTALSELQAARLSISKKAAALPSTKKVPASMPEPEPLPEADQKKPAEIVLSLEEYLERVEKAETYYDVLGVEPKSDIAEIKRSYLGLAKLFHPDRYHKEDAVTMKRVQSAFTKLAHAHETLKSKDGRETYDYKLKKNAEIKAKQRAAGADPGDKITETAFESFEQGKSAFAAKDFGAAITHFGRAVHYAPQNALFKAHYGDALSADERQRHKAEAEMNAAVKMEPKNAEIRFILVNFYLRHGMNKRAEGELNRFLEAVPGHREAAAMLRKVTAG